jgi:hypothetical protein
MRAVGQSLLPLEWDHGHPSEECPGEAVTFSQTHAVKTLAFVHVPDVRLSIKGVKAFPFFIFPVKKEHTLNGREGVFLFYDPFPLSSSLPVKIRDDSCCY